MGVHSRVLTVSAALLAAALLVACGGGSDDSDDTGDADDSDDQVAAGPVGTVTPESALSTVETFDPAEETAVASLNEVVSDGGDYVPSLEPLLDDDDPNVRWAAVYVISGLTDTDDEIAVLEPVLADDDAILSVTAAGSLAGLGVTAALPVLIEALSSDADLPYSDPPRPLSAHAQFTLEQYTGESFDDPADWESWWDDAGSDIRFEDGEYVTE